MRRRLLSRRAVCTLHIAKTLNAGSGCLHSIDTYLSYMLVKCRTMCGYLVATPITTHDNKKRLYALCVPCDYDDNNIRDAVSVCM